MKKDYNIRMLSQSSCRGLWFLLAMMCCYWQVGCFVPDYDSEYADQSDRASNSNHAEQSANNGTNPANRDEQRNTDNNTSVAPLPNSVFVYIHAHSDEERSFYAYDVATDKNWLIKTLRYQKGSGDIQLSPDRRWIAFTAYMQSTAQEQQSSFQIAAAWILSVDGKQLRRISTPIPDPISTKPGMSIYLSDPSWSRDGKMLWLSYSQFWTEGMELRGGSSIVSVPLSGGSIRFHSKDVQCLLSSTPMSNPQTNSVAVVHSMCSNASKGIYLYDTELRTGSHIKFQKHKVDVDTHRNHSWTPNGRAIIFSGYTNWEIQGNNGKEDNNGYGLLIVEVSTGEVLPLLPPLKSGFNYGSFAMSPDSRYLVVQIKTQSASDLYLFDLHQSNFSPIRLTDDGLSRSPSW